MSSIKRRIIRPICEHAMYLTIKQIEESEQLQKALEQKGISVIEK